MSAAFPLSTLQPKPLRWLWRPRLPAGRLALLIGHPDRGKSILAGTLASHLSTGRPWPDGQPCVLSTVLLLEAEDSLEETIVPRLLAAGADLTRIYTWKERTLRQLPDLVRSQVPALVVLSPLNTYLPAINTWDDQKVRHVLQPLADLAEETGVTLLGIMHPPKKQQSLPLHAVIGSVGFGAVARSVLIVERGDNGLYLLESIKQNLAHTTDPIGYRLLPSPTDPEVPLLVWEAVASIASLLPGDEDRSALAEACEFVRMVLADGPVASTALKVAADRNGVAWRTIMRARKLLGIHPYQVVRGDKSHWELSLPTSPPK